jgi:uncharacterized protein with PQ loop repeat
VSSSGLLSLLLLSFSTFLLIIYVLLVSALQRLTALSTHSFFLCDLAPVHPLLLASQTSLPFSWIIIYLRNKPAN